MEDFIKLLHHGPTVMREDLLELIDKSTAMTDDDFDFFRENYSHMTTEQVARFYEILEEEQEKLSKLLPWYQKFLKLISFSFFIWLLNLK